MHSVCERIVTITVRLRDASWRLSCDFGRLFVVATVLAFSGCNGTDTPSLSESKSQSQPLLQTQTDSFAPEDSLASTFVARRTVNAVTDFGAAADGVSDDEPALQRALDFVATHRGGTVYLPAGTYGIARPLVLRSGVHLVGDGYGQSIVRTLVHSPGKVVNRTGIWAAIAMLAANNASVTRLTVDLATMGTHANGIAFLPQGADFEGVPSINCMVSEVEVLGGGNYHAYMIWNLRGRGITITNNLIDGRILEPVESFQEGIESYGGKGVVIGWNTIRNIGNTALNFGSAGMANTDIDGLTVIGNTVSNSGRGLNIGPWLGESGPQNISNVRLENNVFERLWNAGIYVPIQRGTKIENLLIASNRIEGVGSVDRIGAAGMHFQGTPASLDLPAGQAINMVVAENRLHDIRGANSFGMLVNYMPDLTITGNEIDEVDNYGVQAYGSTDLVVENNVIAQIGSRAVGSYGPNSTVFVRGNTIIEWEQLAPFAGVRIENAVAGEVRNNEFQRNTPSGPVVVVTATAADVVVFGNTVTSSVPQQQLPFALFVNKGAKSNTGTFVAVAQATSIEVPNALVTPTSLVNVAQMTGAATPVTAVPGSGVILVTFAVAPQGGETFRYEISP